MSRSSPEGSTLLLGGATGRGLNAAALVVEGKYDGSLPMPYVKAYLPRPPSTLTALAAENAASAAPLMCSMGGSKGSKGEGPCDGPASAQKPIWLKYSSFS